MSFLPPPGLRQMISVPTQDKIDFRAACFCHKNIVDIGFVCSVCLSIFCQPVPICSTCRCVSSVDVLRTDSHSRRIQNAVPDENTAETQCGKAAYWYCYATRSCANSGGTGEYATSLDVHTPRRCSSPTNKRPWSACEQRYRRSEMILRPFSATEPRSDAWAYLAPSYRTRDNAVI